MKNIFTLSALLFTMASFAAAPPKNSRIVITNSDNSFIQVKINGTLYSLDNNTIVLNNIYPGRHKIEVFKTEKRSNRWFRPRPQLIYSSTMFIESSSLVDININRAGNVRVQKNVDNRYDDHKGRGRDNDYDNGPRGGRPDRKW